MGHGDGSHTHGGGGDAGLVALLIIVIGAIAIAPVIGAIIHAITIMLMVLVPTVAVAGIGLLYFKHTRAINGRQNRPDTSIYPPRYKGEIPSAERIADEVMARIRKELER
jgi:hypothetical protein